MHLTSTSVSPLSERSKFSHQCVLQVIVAAGESHEQETQQQACETRNDAAELAKREGCWKSKANQRKDIARGQEWHLPELEVAVQ